MRRLQSLLIRGKFRRQNVYRQLNDLEELNSNLLFVSIDNESPKNPFHSDVFDAVCFIFWIEVQQDGTCSGI